MRAVLDMVIVNVNGSSMKMLQRGRAMGMPPETACGFGGRGDIFLFALPRPIPEATLNYVCRMNWLVVVSRQWLDRPASIWFLVALRNE